jgi:hypothetical protein
VIILINSIVKCIYAVNAMANDYITYHILQVLEHILVDNSLSDDEH